MTIYYFSGTGNSLFVARQLQEKIGDASLVPIVSLLNQKTIPINDTAIGIVFPVHALTIPIVVRRFLRKAVFPETAYIFAVSTRMGSVFRGFEIMDRLLRRQKKRLDAAFIVTMLNNDARHGAYAVPTHEDIVAVEKSVIESLDVIAPVIRDRLPYRVKDENAVIVFEYSPVVNRLMEHLVTKGHALSEYIGGVNYFYTDESCTGCGLCRRICLSEKISIADGKPSWDKKKLCYMCFACLNFCPRKAVQIKSIPGVKSLSRENGRYPHPYATAADLERQKTKHL